MQVFVTGGTGFIGSVVVRELLAAGHDVLGLARSTSSADALIKAGAKVHRGELTDKESLVAGVQACDAVIHLAFIHDFSAFAASVETDRQAVETMINALDGTGKPFVLTSGTALLPLGRLSTEQDSASPDAHRGAAEEIVLAAASRGVRSSIVRLPPSVHGAGDYGFVPMLIDVARRKGVAAYIGDGNNVWPAVHRVDAASAFRLALAKAEPGTKLHAVAEQGIPMRSIAETIGAGLGIPVRGLSEEAAKEHFEWMAMFVGLNNPASSAATREKFGWTPKEKDLLTDIRESGYLTS
jgi:nucleoside-diphosphate-sugar epimerase